MKDKEIVCSNCKTKVPLKEVVWAILQENRMALYVGRVPAEYKEKFIATANERFDGDFNMALMDYMNKADKVELLEELLKKTYNSETVPKEKDNRIVMANGRVIERKPRIERGVVNESGTA